jgi:O-antigen/teichoic acid export membrane protein
MLNKLKPKSEFARNVLTLMTGTTIAQAIPIAISPILTRIYTPEDFGIFALYMSVASILSVVATGRYELAIMLPKKDEDAINIVALSILISFFVSFIALLIVFFFNAQITNLLGNPKISSWLYFVPLTVLLTGVYQSFNYWSNRKKNYRRLAITRVVQSTTIASSNLGMGFGGFGASGLIMSTLLGQGIATTVLGRLVWRDDKKIFKRVRKLKMFALMKKYKKLPIFNLPNALIDGFRLSGIMILIAKFFTTATLGQFSLAWKMVQTPMSLIGSSLAQVFFHKITVTSKDELYPIVKKFILKGVLLSTPIFLLIYFFSTDIFIYIFGLKWKLAGDIASILSPWIFLNFISSPLSILYIVLGKEKIGLFFSILYMLIPLFIIYFFNQLNILFVFQYISIAMSIMLIVFISVLIFYIRKINYINNLSLGI